MRFRRSPGTEDILPPTSRRWQWVEATFREVCERFGYEEIRTPLFEETELFTRSVGAGSDLVEKEMYTFQDRGGRSLTLRAEGTAPVIRAFIENGLAGQGGVHKFYYIAAIFRYERKQKGRYRQHHQTGVELLGSPEPEADVEVLHLGWTYLHTLGIEGLHLELNSVGCPQCRPRYREALRAFLQPRLGELCPDCRRRFQVNLLRVLDCKNEGCRAVTEHAPPLLEFLCEGCRAHFEGVQAGLRNLSIPFSLQPRLVRGLDYYTRTAFEISHPALGAQSVVLGGGRYDGLAEECGGPPTPGVGFGCGLERTLLILKHLGREPHLDRRPLLFVAAVSPEERQLAQNLVARLRQEGFRVEWDLLRRSLKAQMREANRQGATLTLLLRGDLLPEQRIRAKWMDDGHEEDWPLEELLPRLREASLLQASQG